MASRLGKGNLTEAEKVLIVALSQEQGWKYGKIAKELGRSRTGVMQFLKQMESTSVLAKQHFAAKAYEMAQRVTSEANVEQSLEVLDRIDVLPKKRDEVGSRGPSVVVCVGMPGNPALPGPSEAEWELAGRKVIVGEVKE